MDDLLFIYPVLMVAGVLFNIVFFGGVIYLAVKALGGVDPRAAHLVKISTGLLGTYSGQNGAYEPGPVESRMNQMAGENGIDLSR